MAHLEPVSSPSRPPRLAPDERERLFAEFTALCELPSPSRRERRVADLLLSQLRGLGLEVEEDASGAETRSDAGNLLARLPGPDGAPTILLSAHMDTVPLAAPVEVVREDGCFRNAHPAILGADNKAAVAVILAAVRRLRAGGSPVGLELLFTTCEEEALAGAKAFDRGRLRAGLGFVFDHATPIGEVVLASATYYRIEAELRGQAAHAGLHPERGRNAIAAAARAVSRLPLGRLDAETTANVGLIEGGSAANVVAERCHVVAEARSVDPERAGALVTEIVDVFTEAATDGECDVETRVEELFRGYRLPRSSPPVAAATAALRDAGIEPRFISTGGGSDANVLIAGGLPCVNVANGTTGAHEPDEAVTEEALETMVGVLLRIVARCA
jgi:tripeptide aminopeptidase